MITIKHFVFGHQNSLLPLFIGDIIKFHGISVVFFITIYRLIYHFSEA